MRLLTRSCYVRRSPILLCAISSIYPQSKKYLQACNKGICYLESSCKFIQFSTIMQSTPGTLLPLYPDSKCIVSDALLASQCRPYQWRASPVLWGAASRKLQVCVSPPAVSTPVNTEAVALWSSPVDVRHHSLLPLPIHICT